MNVLVTGGAGYIGSHTVRRLLDLGHGVLVCDNLSTGHQATVDTLQRLHPACRFVPADIGDRDTMSRVFDDFKPVVVVHFAAHLDVAESTSNPLKYYANNLAGTVTLLQVMQKAGCQSLIFSSSCASYGQPEGLVVDEDTPQNPLSPYGRSKWMVEQMLRDCASAWGLSSVALRYFNVGGASGDALLGEHHDPEVHLIPRVLMAIHGELPILDICGTDYPTPDGTCIRDYLHVEDIAEAHVLMLDRMPPGQFRAYNLGTGVGNSVREIISAAEAVTGRKCPVREGPRRPGDPACLVSSAERIIRDHGWQPRYTRIHDIIETAWKSYLKHVAEPGYEASVTENSIRS